MIKTFVGDAYLCGVAIKSEIPADIRNNPLIYRESDKFDMEEMSFISSLGFFGTTTLVYKTGKLEANDNLLALLECGTENNLYIIAETIVKGRKLYNKLNSLGCITGYSVDNSTFTKLLLERSKSNGYQLSLSQVEYIAKRCGFYERDVVISAQDIVSWADRLSSSGDYSNETIDSVVPKYRPDNVFLLKDCLMKRQSKEVMEIADSIISNKGQPIAALSAILIDVRILLKLSYFNDNKILRRRAVEEMGVKRICNYSYSTKHLSLCFERICEGIHRLKSGYIPGVEFKNTLADCITYLCDSDD